MIAAWSCSCMVLSKHKETKRSIMKPMLIAIFLISYRLVTSGQGIGGFFNQQTSKQKIMLEQIAGLQARLNLLKTGNNITETGLNTAGDLKGRTFSLRETYFNSLFQVSPGVSSNPKIKNIAELQQQIMLVFNRVLSWRAWQNIFTTAERNYVRTVYAGVLKKSQEDQEELALVLTPGKLHMTEYQRLERIDHINASMQEKYNLTRSIAAKCRMAAMDRLTERRQDEQLKKLYGLK
jgi:hypothetical protein